MNIQENIARFEAELGKIQRPGVDKLMEYIRKSDFYTAPGQYKVSPLLRGRTPAAQPQRAGCPPWTFDRRPWRVRVPGTRKAGRKADRGKRDHHGPAP